MKFTANQRKAIKARGNVLVVAGAGTGKTNTLVERCLDCLIEDGATLDEILMVTFTEAAAAEMRERIRARLEEQMASQPTDTRWPEQLAVFDTAHLGTLHGFCLQLIRQHFYELELDPQLTVLPEEEARLLADETLDKIIQDHYADKATNGAAVQQLIQIQGRGSDKSIRALVLKLHHYTQTLRNPAKWFEEQMELFRSPEPTQWRAWLAKGFADWRERWLPTLQDTATANPMACDCTNILRQLPATPSDEIKITALADVDKIYQNPPKGKITAWRNPLEPFFDEAAFLKSLMGHGKKVDPLEQDWNWTRKPMFTLLELAREFTIAFSETKRETGAVDFHDLEQHALRLLLNPDTNQPTATAQAWRKKLKFVFVDEYQDINEAQDAILQALSREGAAANRFLVGDVKQSIYRFRLADPRIFQNYIDTWNDDGSEVIPLVENFRSRESILEFVNSVFGAVMRRDLGSVPYDEKARLEFGDRAERFPLSRQPGMPPAVELHLRLKESSDAAAAQNDDAASQEIVNLEESAKEARLTAMRLRELRASGHQVWCKKNKAMRPVAWADMAVLMRSPSGKKEIYAREFARTGVPLTVARGGFYDSMEIMDLLALLQLLDNPLQDLPALATLHSPLVGLTLDELAGVRLALPKESKAHIWTALQRYHKTQPRPPGWAKANRFLQNFAKWRKLARQVSLSRCLEAVLTETHYAEWLLTQPRGEQRHANAQRLLALTQQFDQFQRQGLLRFLHFIDAQQAAETEPEVAAVGGEDTVALMSIHQSKGLEFPVVVVADLGKPFNESELKAEIILDSAYGLCPQIKPPQTGRRYPSLPYWLARQRQKKEALGEELRLLYVAMTRARDTLILTGTLRRGRFEKQWQTDSALTTQELEGARNYLDWIGAWSAKASLLISPEGENEFWRWTIYGDLDSRLADDGAAAEIPVDKNNAPLSAADWETLRGRMDWVYPHTAATKEPAKTSVSAVRRRLAQEEDDETALMFKFQQPTLRTKNSKKLSAAEIGTAHHLFLQQVALEKTGSETALREEAQRMLDEKSLSAEEMAALDMEALAAFWCSELGDRIRAQADNVRRELAFTAAFSPTELFTETAGAIETAAEGEFVVVQGVADLVVLLPQEIWLVDFKTDRITDAELPEKVKQYEIQLALYAQALQRIYSRPVTEVYLYFLGVKKAVKISA